MKKVIFGVIGLVLIFGIIGSIFVYNNNKVLNLTQEAVLLSQSYLKILNGDTSCLNRQSKYYSNELNSVINDYVESLEELDNQVFNVDDYYNTYVVPVEMDNGDFIPMLFKDIASKTSEKDDTRIYKLDDVNVIKVKDLCVGSIYDKVVYNGVELPIDVGTLPATYTSIKKDTTNVYKYVNHKVNKDKKYVDVKFNSVIDSGKSCIIRVGYKGNYKINNIYIK